MNNKIGIVPIGLNEYTCHSVCFNCKPQNNTMNFQLLFLFVVTPLGKVLDEALVKNETEITHIYAGKDMDQANDTDVQFTNELVESLAESVQLHEDKDVALKSERHGGPLDTCSDVMNVELPKELFVDCSIWDFAGQKEFYATHQAFLTNSAIYLLTVDLSKAFTSERQKRICDVDFGEVGCKYILLLDYTFMVFNTTFNNISVYPGSEFYWWRGTQKKPTTCRQSLTNFIT